MQKYANPPKKIDKLNEITNNGKKVQVQTNILKLVNGAIAENDIIIPTVVPVIIQSQSLIHPRR